MSRARPFAVHFASDEDRTELRNRLMEHVDRDRRLPMVAIVTGLLESA